MKKTMMQLAVAGLVLACATAVFSAPAERTVFRTEPWTAIVQGGIHANAAGYVVVQPTKGGGAQVTVQLQQAASRYTYVVKSKGQVLGKFTTNAKGTGGLQFFVADANPVTGPLGQYINIWQTAGEFSSYWGAPSDGTYDDWNSWLALPYPKDDFPGLGLLWGPRW